MLRPLLSPLTHVCLYILLGIPQAEHLVELGMMQNAFDDQYIGCEEEMDRHAPGLLVKEMSNSPLFRTAWEKSENHWKIVKTKLSLLRGFKDEHGRAVIVYTDRDFHRHFSEEEKKNWKSRADYMNNFPFKAFHYYLTRALQLLRGSCDVMYKQKVYRGTTDSHTGSGCIRFGYFASSSFDREVAVQFTKATIFTIHTCFGVNITKFSYNPKQKEVLIPVHEIFNVPSRQNFVLQSTNRTCSNFNCAFLNGEKNKCCADNCLDNIGEKKSVCVDNSATRGGIAFPSQTSPSLFGGSIVLIHVAALKLFASF